MPQTPSFWACAMTYSMREAEAVVNLRRQGFKTFYPFFFVKDRIVPAFPGYIFILTDDHSWPAVWNTRGVLRPLTGATGSTETRKPARVPDEFIENMRRYARPRSSFVGDAFPHGTVVKIRRGPFAERTALVLLSGEERVRVLLHLLGRPHEVEFLVEELERAEAL